MIRTGLCSVTYRNLPAPAVLQAAADAGLQVIEWGADVHAPPDDLRTVSRLGKMTVDAGLTVCSYGTYYEAGVHPDENFTALSRAAAELGTSRLRVWAGNVASSSASPETRRRVVDALKRAADHADREGQSIALEFHDGSLSDSAASVLELLENVGRANLSSYWQASLNTPAPEAVDELRALLPVLSAVHVFSWWPDDERHPLTYRSDLWTQAFSILRAQQSPMDAMLEFVPDDDPLVLAAEAAALHRFATGTP